MKKELTTLTTLSAAAIVMSGCCSPIQKTADILKEDKSKVAFAINKDYTSTAINVNTGERLNVAPCKTDIPDNISITSLTKEIQKCLPPGHKKVGKVLTQGSFMLFEGTHCIADIINGELYLYCQPPTNLGF